jgi:hypothetical protein
MLTVMKFEIESVLPLLALMTTSATAPTHLDVVEPRLKAVTSRAGESSFAVGAGEKLLSLSSTVC